MGPKSALRGRFRDEQKAEPATKEWYDKLTSPEQEAPKLQRGQLKQMRWMMSSGSP